MLESTEKLENRMSHWCSRYFRGAELAARSEVRSLVLNTSLEKVTKVILTPDQDLIYSCPGMHVFGPGYFYLPAGGRPAGG